MSQETQSLFDFRRLVLNILLHYQLPADLWCITEVLVVTLACSALFQTWKFAVLEPNASLSAGTTNCRQQIFPQSHLRASREQRTAMRTSSVTVPYKCRQQQAIVCGERLLAKIILSLCRDHDLQGTEEEEQYCWHSPCVYYSCSEVGAPLQCQGGWRNRMMVPANLDVSCSYRKTRGHHQLAVVRPLHAADGGEMLLYRGSCCSPQLKCREVFSD